jgi:hypothetical protein
MKKMNNYLAKNVPDPGSGKISSEIPDPRSKKHWILGPNPQHLYWYLSIVPYMYIVKGRIVCWPSVFFVYEYRYSFNLLPCIGSSAPQGVEA